MSAKTALQHVTRRSGDSDSGWLTADRIRAAIVQIYDDMGRSAIPVIEERVVQAPPLGRSSHIAMLPQIDPADGWVIIEHGMNSEAVIVQATAGGLVVPLGIRVVGPNSVSVHAGDNAVNQPIRVVIIR
jgi:hypothetical protein